MLSSILSRVVAKEVAGCVKHCFESDGRERRDMPDNRRRHRLGRGLPACGTEQPALARPMGLRDPSLMANHGTEPRLHAYV